MNVKRNSIFVLYLIGLTLISGGCYGFLRRGFSMNYTDIKNVADVKALFPTTVGQIEELVNKTKQNAQKRVAEIIAVPDAERSFANTAFALDEASGFYLSVPICILVVLSNVSPDDAVRDAANKYLVELSQFAIDLFGQNVELYNAFKAYTQGNARKETLNDEEKYFIKETMEEFKREGLDFSEEKRNKIKELKKQLAELSNDFEKNINEDKTTVIVTPAELKGMDEDFIKGLKKTDDGNYILTIDYSVYYPIIEYNELSPVRKKMYQAFLNRAYPVNIEVLKKVISLRDQLAKELGYKSFADLNIDGEMAKNSEHARQFINNLIDRAKQKSEQEFEELKTDLPESVELEQGKIKPWDGAFAKETFRKKHYQVDDREVKKYFPMQKTIDGLLSIYEKFFNIQLKKSELNDLWAPDLTMIEAYKGDTLLGYLILDLYPRPNKYSHACAITVVPTLKTKEGRTPAVAVVLANFPKPVGDKPSLLELTQVRTFFHEFGHAIHGILGATELSTFSGLNTKRDFVEMPSQMLEEWLWDAEILKLLSSHYQTGQPLPDDMIKKILATKNFSSGAWVTQQALYALLALDYFAPGMAKDVMQILFALEEKLKPHMVVYKDTHMPAGFGHLMDYGAKYYGYLWSKVFALDLFNHIKKYGLLNPEIGEQYAQKVIGKGGSKDPNELLKDFLGREPNADAFFADLGL
ncbi:MAG: M3 family metallopeptidase [Candidatus Babeliales bacterium]